MTDVPDLLYMRARYYSPSIGRFINKDPIGLAGGMNMYGYVGGNPINLIDPLGLCSKNPDEPFLMISVPTAPVIKVVVTKGGQVVLIYPSVSGVGNESFRIWGPLRPIKFQSDYLDCIRNES